MDDREARAREVLAATIQANGANGTAKIVARGGFGMLDSSCAIRAMLAFADREKSAALAGGDPVAVEREAVFDALHTLGRIVDLTPARSNAHSADDFHGAIKAIALAAIDRLKPAVIRSGESAR